MARIDIPDGEGTERERIYALRPSLGAAAKALRDEVYASTLPHRLKELVRYRIAVINDCSFWLGIRAPSGTGQTLSEDLYSRIREFRGSDLYSEAEQAAIEYAELFATNHTAIGDAVFARLGKHFDAGEIFELSVLVARHFAFGRLTRVLEIDIACALPGAD